jgi:hypothetical protein
LNDQNQNKITRKRGGANHRTRTTTPEGTESDPLGPALPSTLSEESKKKQQPPTQESAGAQKEETRGERMDSISKKLATLDSRRQELAKKLDEAQKSADYDSFQKIGNSYLGTILQSIDLYIELIKEISSEPVSDELKNEFSEIVKKGSKSQGIESQSEWISNDVSPLYEKVRQICACVYAAVAKIDQEANKIG